MADDMFDRASAQALDDALARVESRTAALTISANSFASAMTRAFTQSVSGGRQFDDVLRSLGLKLSSLVVGAAFKPIAASLTGGFDSLFGNLAGVQAAAGGLKPFAAGGVIGTPTYFPLLPGGLGLAGEAGPEAILPLKRGPDGQLGVAAATGGAPATTITVNIATPDVESFRRSETYITGQIARAVARGQRSL